MRRDTLEGLGRGVAVASSGVLGAIVFFRGLILVAAVFFLAPAANAQRNAVFDWTGFYAGIHGGYAWSSVDVTGGPSVFRPDGDGGLAGIHLGYNWQRGNFVYGVEADGSWASIWGAASCPNPAFTCSSEVESIFSVRGRLGVTTGPQAFIYTTFGWAYAHIKYKSRPVVGGFDFDFTHNGPAVGLGIESALSERWSWRVEYLAYLLQTKHQDMGGGTLSPDPVIHALRFGLNYGF